MSQYDTQTIGHSPDLRGERPQHSPRKWWRARTADPARRLIALNRTIATYPDHVSGYVLRGELYVTQGCYAQAMADFQAALRIAERQLYTERWGVIEQVMRDRASIGLRRAQQAEKQNRRPAP